MLYVFSYEELRGIASYFFGNYITYGTVFVLIVRSILLLFNL